MSGAEKKEEIKTGKPQGRWISGILRFYLKLAWYVGIIWCFLLVVFVVIAGIGEKSEAVQVSVDAELLHPDAAKAGDMVVKLVGARAAVMLKSTDLTTRILLNLGTIILLFLGLAIVFLLRRIVDAHIKSSSFQPRNAARVRYIGLLLIGGEVLSCISSYFTSSMVASRAILDGLSLSPSVEFNEPTIFMGLVCLVLAEVFHRGASIEEEQALTV